MIKEIKIPEIGENVTDGTVVGVLVSEGDTVEAEQSIIEFETDKAVVEIPSPAKGKITEISVSKGDTIGIDEVIAKLETDEDVDESAGEPKEKDGDEEKASEDKQDEAEEEKDKKEKKKKDESADESEDEESEDEETADDEEQDEEEKDESDDEDEEPDEDRDKSDDDQKPGKKKEEKPAAKKADKKSEKDEASTEPRPQHEVAPAAPSVRRLARELGADINRVKGTGPGGRISIDDVKAYVKDVVQSGGGEKAGGQRASRRLPEFERWGDVRREKMSRVRNITADSVGYAWNVVPHVTQFDKADITALNQWMEKAGKKVEKAGGKLTVTAVIMKVIAEALGTFPRFNASIDLENEQLILKKYVHLGMAVDTDRGLLVPVIRDVDRKSITDLAVEIMDVAERTRNKKIKPDELEGGTFTISNQGGIGGTDFTPIVYWPQTAILGISRAAVEPKYVDGEVKPRTILPLSLSYDHRIVDGADAARFLRWVCDALENAFTMHLD